MKMPSPSGAVQCAALFKVSNPRLELLRRGLVAFLGNLTRCLNVETPPGQILTPPSLAFIVNINIINNDQDDSQFPELRLVHSHILHSALDLAQPGRSFRCWKHPIDCAD